jgi:hypothetical protein
VIVSKRSKRALRMAVDVLSPTGRCPDTPRRMVRSTVLQEKRRPGFPRRADRRGLPTRPFRRVPHDPPRAMWITPRSLDLSLAYEVGNLRDPRVGNIMTLDRQLSPNSPLCDKYSPIHNPAQFDDRSIRSAQHAEIQISQIKQAATALRPGGHPCDSTHSDRRRKDRYCMPTTQFVPPLDEHED